MTTTHEPPALSATASTIFVVEDEALIAMEIQDNLEALGYRVCGHAARGEAALEKIRELRPDLILMDIHLAGRLSGIDTAAQLGEEGSGAVVFLSAYSDPTLLSQAMRTAPLGYLVKPVSQRGLHAAIEVALHRHRWEREVRASRAGGEERAGLQDAAQRSAHAPDRLTVCPHCRSVHVDAEWMSFERYVASHLAAGVAYVPCPHCRPPDLPARPARP